MISVVLPCLNEPHLPQLISEIGTTLGNNYEILVQSEKGLSYAVWCGIQKAQGNIIVVMDVDGSHPPSAIPFMVKMLNAQTHFVAGSKHMKQATNYDSTIHKLISHIYRKLAQLFLHTTLSDSLSGFWVGYKTHFQFKPNGSWKFSVQLIKKNNGYIKEYPICFQPRREGKSHATPLQALITLWEIIKP